MPSPSEHPNPFERPIHARGPLLGEQPPGSASARSAHDLHLCPDCGSNLVQPIEWAPVDASHWRVELACPECRWGRAGVYPQSVLDRFDAILDDGASSLMDDLSRLERANMADEIDRFAAALSSDAILPEDF